MKKCLISFVALSAMAAVASASPVINGAVVKTRIFNDNPGSTVTFTNAYPSEVRISDVDNDAGAGFANRHNFRLSDNGGANEAVFLNGDGFDFAADVRLYGADGGLADAPVEGGLNVSPWWSHDVDGVFAIIPANGGEIACFGGRLPFYSFTSQFGLHYTFGDTVRMGVKYRSNGLSMASPATIEYIYTDMSGTYSSGPLAFDQGNPAEDPPYGLWGMLNDARVGGFMQRQIAGGTNEANIRFSNIVYAPEPSSLALLALAGLAAFRRR